MLQNIEISETFSQNFGRKRAATTRNPIICKQKPSTTQMMNFSNLRKAEFNYEGQSIGGSGMRTTRTARENSSPAFHTGGGAYP